MLKIAKFGGSSCASGEQFRKVNRYGGSGKTLYCGFRTGKTK